MIRVLTVSIATASILAFSAVVVAQDDEYKALDPNEVSCSISDFNYQGTVAAGGAIAPTAGHIGSFQCRLHDQDSTMAIPLAKDEFVDGGIVTKDFGVFKVLFGASLTGGSSASLMATDAQMAKLKAFLAAKSSDGVKQPLIVVQAKLRELGFDPGPVDGTWGARTESAVRQFQRTQGLDDTGQLNSNTREALQNPSQLDYFDFNPIKKETEQLAVPEQYATIQRAINAAKDGATIVISAGIYEETVVVSKKSLTLTSDNPGNDTVVASTIIDAKHKGNTIVLQDSSSIIIGLTIRGGCTENKGGGIRVFGKSSPLIKGNIIENNSTAMLGGGIAIIQAGEPRIVDNTIKNNEAKGGGGVYAISSSVYMKNNRVLSNTVTKGGGGVWLQEGKGVLHGNLLTGNSAGAGGGLYISSGSEVNLVANEIRDNDADVGGGMFVIKDCKVQIQNNSFVENMASKAAGGIVIAFQSVVTLTGNRFEKNEAPEGAVGIVEKATAEDKNNTFTDNKPDNTLLRR